MWAPPVPPTGWRQRRRGGEKQGPKLTWKEKRQRREETVVIEGCISNQQGNVVDVEKAINNSLRTRFVQFRVDFVIRELI